MDVPVDSQSGSRASSGGYGGEDGVPLLQERFAELLARNHAPLMSYILSILPHWADADDVLQHTSVVLWRKFHDYRPDTDFLTWALQIARFEALNYYRKQQRDRLVFSRELVELLAEEGMNETARLEAERFALRGCLEKLDARARSLLEQSYQIGTSLTEVAGSLGCTPNALYKNLNRIRASLLVCIQRALSQESV